MQSCSTSSRRRVSLLLLLESAPPLDLGRVIPLIPFLFRLPSTRFPSLAIIQRHSRGVQPLLPSTTSLQVRRRRRKRRRHLKRPIIIPLIIIVRPRPPSLSPQVPPRRSFAPQTSSAPATEEEVGDESDEEEDAEAGDEADEAAWEGG